MPEKSKSTTDLEQIYRVLDANLNRASEGLRTLDDFLRFVENNQELASQVKHIRHDLVEALQPIDRRLLLKHRDTVQDVGTRITTNSEMQRTDCQSIVTAAAQRTQQAVRSLEEYSKLLSVDSASALEAIRYRLYTVCGRIELLALASKFQSQTLEWLLKAQFYVLVDCRDSLDIFANKIKTLADSSVDLIQIRDKDASSRKLLTYTRAAIDSAGKKMKVIVNDRLDIALASGAEGVHLGQDDLPIEIARKQSPEGFCIGISTHSIDQAMTAEESGADYIGCGPTFPSTTKQFDSFPGTKFLVQAHEQISIPAFAIGGINHSNIDQVIATGVNRIAVSSAIWGLENMHPLANQLKAKLGSYCGT